MKIKALVLIALTATLAMAQTDLIYPWVTNNDLFNSTLAINNLNGEAVTVNLTATRQAGSDPESVVLDPIEIPAYGQFVSSGGELFSALGSGGGFTVRLTSDASNIAGAFVNVGTGTDSGTSPSQANVFEASSAAPIILYSYLTLDAGFSSPVVYNTSDSEAAVTFHAYQDGLEIATADRTIPAGHPHAELTGDLFPGATGNLYVVAESDQPIVGVAFIFNDAREPSMANAIAIDSVPDPGSNTPMVSFANDIQPIFNATCGFSGCHQNNPEPPMGLNLTEGEAYAAIVGVPASEQPQFNQIEPFMPDQSYLYRKLLNPTEGNYNGSRMPRFRAPLDEETMSLIRNWILQGAQDN